MQIVVYLFDSNKALLGLKDRFDIAFACDTDHDRHGVVMKSTGLLQPNHYLSVSVHYLFRYRPKWRTDAAVGKTVVSSQMIPHFDGVPVPLEAARILWQR